MIQAVHLLRVKYMFNMQQRISELQTSSNVPEDVQFLCVNSFTFGTVSWTFIKHIYVLCQPTAFLKYKLSGIIAKKI